MTHFSIKCAHCGEMFATSRKNKYCTEQCKNRAAYERALAKAPKCPVCGGPHLAEGKNPRPACNKCYKAGRTSGVNTSEGYKGTCESCGVEWSGKHRYKKCSPCRFEAQKARAAAKGACTMDGCTEPQFCKGVCNKHYWTDYTRTSTPREYPDIHKTCKLCGIDFTTKVKQTEFCSLNCGGVVANMRRRGEDLSNSKELVLVNKWAYMRSWVGHTIPARDGMPLMAGECIHCGDTFVARYGARYCSKRCNENASWKRRYETRGEFYINPRARKAIYERDDWTCQICNAPVPKDANPGDLEYPTLDHIIPQSHQIVPDHSPTNLRLAHMICNARRGNRVEYDMVA